MIVDTLINTMEQTSEEAKRQAAFFEKNNGYADMEHFRGQAIAWKSAADLVRRVAESHRGLGEFYAGEDDGKRLS